MTDLLLPLFGYLIGSISSAVLVCRLMRLPDPRSAGSNNPGATNVLRLGGKTAMSLVLLGDLLKGLLPVAAARALNSSEPVLAMVGLAAVCGHLYPVFFGFKGGKGVATTAGVLVALSGTLVLTLLAVWLLIAATTRYASLAALAAAAAAPVMALWLLPGWYFFGMALALTSLIFWRHRDNIRRLLAGRENRLGRR